MTRICARRLRWLATAFLLLCAQPLVAVAQSPEASLKSKILLRALAYDRNLQTRVGTSVTIAVVFNESRATSVAVKNEMHKAFDALGKLTFLSLPINVVAHAYTGEAKLRALITEQGVDILFICPELSDALDPIITVTRATKIASITAETENVQRGVSIGVTLQGKNPRLLVNLPASKAEGLNLSAELMRIADVIRE